ncbi:UDP-N-acetylglucosamine transferase subunit Alg13p [[Candida] anglica]|uniref:UDP-N-acetylglucosamine transferase subunit ALG13 n=1 Tax=[Candida] anglica TaxID=148631 RepID=A0ABP0EDH3_9ASCO
MSTVIVCTGATTTFRELVKAVTSDKFIRILEENGVTKLVIQYGNEKADDVHISRAFFEECFAPVGQLEQDINGIESLQVGKVRVCGFAFSHSIASYIAESDVVVSHAGTGSILDALRLGKSLVVVVNESLMDNHQEEVAREFMSRGHCSVARPHEIASAVVDVLTHKRQFKKFESCTNKIVEGIIFNEASLAT